MLHGARCRFRWTPRVVLVGHALDIAGDGAHLAMGSTTGLLWTGDDAGETWLSGHGRLPPTACLAFGD
jgi:hypothetical protein